MGFAPPELALAGSPESPTLEKVSKLSGEHQKEVRLSLLTKLRDMISTATENLRKSPDRYKRSFDTSARVRRLPDVKRYVHLRTDIYQEASVTPGENFSPKLRRNSSGPYKVLRTIANTHTVVIESERLEERNPLEHLVPASKNSTPSRSIVVEGQRGSSVRRWDSPRQARTVVIRRICSQLYSRSNHRRSQLARL